MWALIKAPGGGWTSAPILLAFGAAAVVGGAFVLWERRAEHPLLDVRGGVAEPLVAQPGAA